jgi:hypothetical protein
MRHEGREDSMSVEHGVFVFLGRHSVKQVPDDGRKRFPVSIEDVAAIDRKKRGWLAAHSTWMQKDDDHLGTGM